MHLAVEPFASVSLSLVSDELLERLNFLTVRPRRTYLAVRSLKSSKVFKLLQKLQSKREAG